MKQFLSIAFLTVVLVLSAQSQTLVHYWNFNDPTNEGTLLTPQSLLQGASITHIQGGLSAIDVAGGTGQNFNIENLNARNGDASGNHLRFNNPIGGTLVFALPTTGFKDVVVKFATRRSGSGAGTQIWEYTTDGTNYTEIVRINPVDGNPTLQSIDFASIPASDNNANFKLKVTFIQGSGGTVGNNRFDNFTLDGVSNAGDTFPPVATFNPLTGAKYLEPSIKPTITFNEDIRLINNDAINNSNAASTLIFKMDNANGSDVAFTATYSNKVMTIIPTNPLMNGKTYYLAIKANMIEDMSDNAIANSPSTVFTILPTQTQFSKGDLVLVAYRMNATGADDEIAILTTVNILPETRINFTDGKYTINNPAQCAGGFIWTAPVNGMAAGTIFTIKTDVGTTSHGTISGSTFGLSSGGDQVMVYTGNVANASHITALSSNAWIANNLSCSGSLSMVPAGLQDGVSSINLSTAPGNQAGNTANAYYNGVQNLPKQQLIASILNPANWLGVASGTPPQVWHVWAFNGPPTVISAKVKNQTTIEVIFNKDLDAMSAINPANYLGISNIQSITRTNNGNARDTVIITYSDPFAKGVAQSLTINNVKDNENVAMFAPYVFNFTYNTSISFTTNFAVVEENAGVYNLTLNLVNPSESSVNLVLKQAPYSTIGNQDIIFNNQTLNFTGNSNPTQQIQIQILEDFIPENDEYFVIYLENANGLSISGTPYITIYIRDNDKKVEPQSDELTLKYVNSFLPNPNGASSTEIVTYDAATKRLFVTSAIQDRLDIVDFSNPASPVNFKAIDMSIYGGITSVAVKNGLVAVASPNANEQNNGSVVFFDTDGNYLKQVTVGALPDMLIFTKDGKKILTANEGQPNDAYTIDPEGSVSIIDLTNGIANLTQQNVTTLLFTQFNANEQQYISSGVRKLKKTSTLSQDLEPEYIAVSDDNKKAWVALQENNAYAEINLMNNTYTSLWALGTKDMMASANGFDASDNNNQILIANWPVKSYYIPDATSFYNYNGINYLISANEGDEKEYAGLNERTTVGASSYVLDPAVYPNAEVLKQSYNLGRLRVTNLNGDENGDGKFEQIHSLGSRSFTIWNADTKQKVWDSGNDFEQIIAKHPQFKSIFNADNEGLTVKARSRAKGPEPEGVTIAKINNQTYAFVSLERVGGVMVYNVTNPNNPYFVDYNNSRLATNNGDLGPEGIIYLNWDESPNGKNLIVVANEISGTITVYEAITAPKVNLADKSTCKGTNEDLGNIVNGLDLTVVNGSGDYTYNWSPSTSLLNKYTSNPTRLNAISTTTYTLTVKDNVTGKTATGSMKLTVYNQPTVSLPVIYYHQKNTSLDLNDLISNISGGKSPYSVVWYDENGIIDDPTNIFPAIGMNRYYAMAIDANGCNSVQKKVNVYVSPRKESQEFEISDNGSITLATYPNPAVNNLNVIVDLNDEKTATLKIMDMSGRIIISTNINSTNFDNQIDVTNLISGTYFVVIETETSSLTGKFIKE